MALLCGLAEYGDPAKLASGGVFDVLTHALDALAKPGADIDVATATQIADLMRRLATADPALGAALIERGIARKLLNLAAAREEYLADEGFAAALASLLRVLALADESGAVGTRLQELGAVDVLLKVCGRMWSSTEAPPPPSPCSAREIRTFTCPRPRP